MALRSIMVGFPPRVLEALLAPGDPRVAVKQLVQDVKAEVQAAIYRTKELATKTVKQVHAMFAITTAAFKNKNGWTQRNCGRGQFSWRHLRVTKCISITPIVASQSVV